VTRWKSFAVMRVTCRGTPQACAGSMLSCEGTEFMHGSASFSTGMAINAGGTAQTGSHTHVVEHVILM